MALRAGPSVGFLQSFFSVASASLRPTAAAPSRTLAQTPLVGKWPLPLLPAIVIPIPSLVTDIWESVLRAVPKKKTSHMKKRHRQMAGKGLKDVTSLNKCSGCGRVKRAHYLCPHCVTSIKRWFNNGFKKIDWEGEARQEEKKVAGAETKKKQGQ